MSDKRPSRAVWRLAGLIQLKRPINTPTNGSKKTLLDVDHNLYLGGQPATSPGKGGRALSPCKKPTARMILSPLGVVGFFSRRAHKRSSSRGKKC
jgi:hypothetical protein